MIEAYQPTTLSDNHFVLLYFQEESPFTFFSQDPEDSGNDSGKDNHTSPVQAEELRFKQWNPQYLPYDSSGDEEEGRMAEEEDNTSKLDITQLRATEQLFFFHVDDPELKNRLTGKL